MATQPDHELSPFTGLTRAHWAEHADRLLLAVRPFADDSHARIRLPGPTSGSGEDSDCLEAFARTFLAAGFRLVGERGADPHDLAGWYARGLAAGTDPANPRRWPRPDELPQVRVEAASLALVLGMTRPWIWDRLDTRVQEQVLEWLGSARGQWYPENNWQWFRIVTASFVRANGGDDWAQDEIDHAFELHERCYVGGGWYTDGLGRNFDHYAGWAWHLYPLLWAEQYPELVAEQLPSGTVEEWRGRLADFVDDAVHLVGADGSPLVQGRSLVYRYAAAAPLWMGALTGAARVPVGQLRRACSGMLSHFTSHGVPDDDGLLNLGWHGEHLPLRQGYSGFGSPYWAAKGLLGLALPADHPVWTAVEEPLPHEQQDTLRVVAAPGWLVSGTRADGVVRVVNHGTDHSTEGGWSGDSPIYARLAYSTATAPPLGRGPELRPADNAVTLRHPDGRWSHRTGFSSRSAVVQDGVAVATSAGPVHWLTAGTEGPNRAYGLGGETTAGPELELTSLVRAGVEVRVARLPDVTDVSALELSGWPLAAAEAAPMAGVRAGGLTSRLRPCTDGLVVGVRTGGSGPLGEPVSVPVLSLDLDRRSGPVTVVALVVLGGPEVVEAATGTRVELAEDVLTVEWADGHRTRFPL